MIITHVAHDEYFVLKYAKGKQHVGIILQLSLNQNKQTKHVIFMQGMHDSKMFVTQANA